MKNHISKLSINLLSVLETFRFASSGDTRCVLLTVFRRKSWTVIIVISVKAVRVNRTLPAGSSSRVFPAHSTFSSCASSLTGECYRTLPRVDPTAVLNLFIFWCFHRQSSHKKKLNTFISFPEVLDMGPFLEGKGTLCLLTSFIQISLREHSIPQSGNDSMIFILLSSDEKCMYELSAVLIHRGVSAYSGHYIAHVRDAHTNDWYKFNDEEIEKMEGKKLQLGIEEDIGKE